MSTMKKIRIGVLGCADIALRMMIPAIRSIPEFELVAVASRTREKADDFAVRFNCIPIVGYKELLESANIDAVYIPLPTGLHYRWIKEALQHDKHVIAEKSLATAINEVGELVELANDRHLVLFENFMFKYHSQILFVKRMIEDKKVGDVRFCRSSFGFPPFGQDNNIRYRSELGGGALLDVGAYTIQGSLLFLGKRLKVIGAHLKMHDQYGIDWWGGALLSNGDGAISQIAFSFDNYYQNSIELWGSTGKIIMERAFTAAPGYMPKVILEKQGERHEFVLPADNHFAAILRSFRDAILSNNHAVQYEELLDQSRLLTKVRKYAERQR